MRSLIVCLLVSILVNSFSFFSSGLAKIIWLYWLVILMLKHRIKRETEIKSLFGKKKHTSIGFFLKMMMAIKRPLLTMVSL